MKTRVSWLTWTATWTTSLSLADKVQLKRPPPSSAFQSTCLTFFGVWTKRDSWGLSDCTVPACDSVPSWQQNPLNRGPLLHKGSTGYTQRAHTPCQTAGHQLHTWHAAIMSPVCGCVSERLCKSCRHHLLRPLWTCPHSVSLDKQCTCVFFISPLFNHQSAVLTLTSKAVRHSGSSILYLFKCLPQDFNDFKKTSFPAFSVISLLNIVNVALNLGLCLCWAFPDSCDS